MIENMLFFKTMNNIPKQQGEMEEKFYVNYIYKC